MGTYRTLDATLPCRRCGAAYAAGVQFKTDDDSAMPEYQAGDVAEDLAPGVYEGSATAFCASCLRRWIEDEKRVHFARLADDVAAGRIVARRATWRHGALDGRPELGLVVTIHDEAPMSADDVRALGEAPEGFGWPTFPARLSTANVALWQGDVRVFPEDTSVDRASKPWWERHTAEVEERLRALGWPDGQEQDVDVAVRVDEERRVWLGD